MTKRCQISLFMVKRGDDEWLGCCMSSHIGNLCIEIKRKKDRQTDRQTSALHIMRMCPPNVCLGKNIMCSKCV